MPLPLSATEPCSGSNTSPETVSTPGSTSESLARTSTVIGVLIGVDARSSFATGVSFTALTVIVTVAMLESALPSVAR